MVARIEPILTVNDLELLPDDGNRYELIEGELIVSRAPSITHQRTVHNAGHILQQYLDENPIGMVIPGPGVIFDLYNSVIPDLVYLSRERAEAIEDIHLKEAPELVIEVLSPGKENSERDRKVKRPVYSKHGVQEYWVLDPQARMVETYRRRGRGLRLAATLTETDVLTTALLPGFSCRVYTLFVF